MGRILSLLWRIKKEYCLLVDLYDCFLLNAELKTGYSSKASFSPGKISWISSCSWLTSPFGLSLVKHIIVLPLNQIFTVLFALCMLPIWCQKRAPKRTVRYLNAHGTATPLGDMVKNECNKNGFRSWKIKFCNAFFIGHALSAAGCWRGCHRQHRHHGEALLV